MTFIFFTFFHYFLNVYNEHILLVKSGKKLTLKKGRILDKPLSLGLNDRWYYRPQFLDQVYRQWAEEAAGME